MPETSSIFPKGYIHNPRSHCCVRTVRDPLPLYPEMHRRIVDIDKDAFVFDVKPMTQLIAESLAPRRFSTILLSAFAAIALILSLAGIYAVIAHSVAQRTVEIGIRMAMGASPASVTGLILRYGLLPAICGMVVGVVRGLRDLEILFRNAVRRRSARSSNMDGRFGLDAGGGVHRELPACATRVRPGSDRGAARRINGSNDRMSEGEAMRALLTAVGTRGDVQPALALALELRKLGHAVRLCISPNFVDWAKSLGLEAVPMGVEMRMPAHKVRHDTQAHSRGTASAARIDARPHHGPVRDHRCRRRWLRCHRRRQRAPVRGAVDCRARGHWLCDGRLRPGCSALA